MPRAIRVLLLASVALAVPATANATTYPVTAGSAASLQAALNAAGGHANSGGADVVSIPAGTYTGSFSYGGDAVDIEGAGQDLVKLNRATAGTTLTLDGPGSTVAGLTVENAVSPAGVGYGLTLADTATVHDVTIRATGANVFGLLAGAPAVASHMRFVVGDGDTGFQMQASGATSLSDATFQGSGSAYGITADIAGAQVNATRVRALGIAHPVVATFGGSVGVTDSLLVLPVGTASIALEAGDNNNPAGHFTSKVQAERLTIVGHAGDNHVGARVITNTAPAGATPGDDFEVHLHNSLLLAVDTPLYCSEPVGTAVVAASWSSLPAGGDSTNSCTTSRTNPVAGTPIFLDAAGGDYRQRFDSPLVDAGDPATTAAASDLDGLPRPKGRVDLGAFEYQRRAPVVSASASPTSAATGQAVAFSASATDPDPGESPVSYTWHFDDGAAATGPSVAHAFSTGGMHTGTVTVTDQAGVPGSATAAVTVVAPGRGADHTPPRIGALRVRPARFRLGSALPKLVSSAVAHSATIRFTLSEAASVKISFERRVGRRYKRVAGTLRVRAAKGGSRVRFAGRISRRVHLRPGAYRVVVRATDAAGNASARARARFRIVAA